MYMQVKVDIFSLLKWPCCWFDGIFEHYPKILIKTFIPSAYRTILYVTAEKT